MLYLDHFQSGDFPMDVREEIDSFNPFTSTPDSPHGFILECDLSYPSHLHIDHNDLPLAPRKYQWIHPDWSP